MKYFMWLICIFVCSKAFAVDIKISSKNIANANRSKDSISRENPYEIKLQKLLSFYGDGDIENAIRCWSLRVKLSESSELSTTKFLQRFNDEKTYTQKMMSINEFQTRKKYSREQRASFWYEQDTLKEKAKRNYARHRRAYNAAYEFRMKWFVQNLIANVQDSNAKKVLNLLEESGIIKIIDKNMLSAFNAIDEIKGILSDPEKAWTTSPDLVEKADALSFLLEERYWREELYPLISYHLCVSTLGENS